MHNFERVSPPLPSQAMEQLSKKRYRSARVEEDSWRVRSGGGGVGEVDDGDTKHGSGVGGVRGGWGGGGKTGGVSRRN